MNENPSLSDEYNTLRAEMMALFDHIRKWEQGTIALFFAILSWFIAKNFPGPLISLILLGLITISLGYILIYYCAIYEKGTYVSLFHEAEGASSIRYVTASRQYFKISNIKCNILDKDWGVMPKADSNVFLALFFLSIISGSYQLFLKYEATTKYYLFGFYQNGIVLDLSFWVIVIIAVIISIIFFVIYSKMRGLGDWVTDLQTNMMLYKDKCF